MANTLYYGGGNCSIEATDIFGLEIRHNGKIRIFDKTSDNYYIIANNKKILIFSIGTVQPLNDLFEYHGEFNIKSVLAADSNAQNVRIGIKKVMDYSQLINTKAEDMNTVSEKLNAGHRHGGLVKDTTVNNNIIKNLHTIEDRGMYNLNLYDKGGKPYYGYFHVHIKNNTIMSASEHTRDSEYLYLRRYNQNKRPIKINKVSSNTMSGISQTKTRRKSSGVDSSKGGY